MSTPVSPVGTQLPHRTTTVQSTATTNTNGGAAVSDDESLIGEDTSEVCVISLR